MKGSADLRPSRQRLHRPRYFSLWGVKRTRLFPSKSDVINGEGQLVLSPDSHKSDGALSGGQLGLCASRENDAHLGTQRVYPISPFAFRSNKGDPQMCDFSLHNVRSRPASVGDKLMTHGFATGTRGFAAFEDRELAVCLLPGTELAFADDIKVLPYGLLGLHKTTCHRTAIFRQINKDKPATHHDAIEFPDGRIELLTMLCENQTATVLQLPAEPKNAAEAVTQERAAYVG